MKRILLTILFMFFINSYFVFAQNLSIDWVKGVYPGNHHFTNPQINKVVIDNFGNSYFTGTFISPIDSIDIDRSEEVFNLYHESNTSSSFIAKVDSIGNLIWAKQIDGGTAVSVELKLDSLDNIYLEGYFSGIVDFDPGTEIYSLTCTGYNTITNYGNKDIFILKLNQDGEFLWANKIGGTFNDTAFDFYVDENGNNYITGHFNSSMDFDPDTTNFITSTWNGAFLAKYDLNGDFVWVKKFGNGDDAVNGYAVTTDKNGNIYLQGKFEGVTDFDPGLAVNNLTCSIVLGSDDFICKLDLNGNFKWVKAFRFSQSTDYEIRNLLVADKNENLFVAGQTYGGDFGPNEEEFIVGSIGLEDVFLFKLDSLGNLNWVKTFGSIGPNSVLPSDLKINDSEFLYLAGIFEGSVNFHSAIGDNTISSLGNSDNFILKIDKFGNSHWVNRIGNSNEDNIHSFDINKYCQIASICRTDNLTVTNSIGISQTVLGYGETIIKQTEKGIFGRIYNDIDENCLQGNYENGLPRNLIINPGNIIVQSNENGLWFLESLPPGNYIIMPDTSGNWSASCLEQQTFSIINSDTLLELLPFAMISQNNCTLPVTHITMPFIRPCFSNQKIFVKSCNDILATNLLLNSYTDVKLDSNIIFQNATANFEVLENNTYRFAHGTLYPGQCEDFVILAQVGCDVLFGQTVCVQSNLFPLDSCIFIYENNALPTDFTSCNLPWDNSNLAINSWCQNDSIYFEVTNLALNGIGNMDCFSPVRIFVDGEFLLLDSLILIGGESKTYIFSGDGRTWRLEVDQHPLHPGNSIPNSTIEACGNSENWTPLLKNIMPHDDKDLNLDIYCGEAIGSYDPNDKTGYPFGYGSSHLILPNGEFDYVIRFQNTGTDTAFTVIVRDTLDMDLNIFSVKPGTSSHPYSFRMYGPRVLEWTFNNILLPDSTTNESESHGFFTFLVDQNPNLEDSTEITNNVGIYFDFNPPIITNTTNHKIWSGINQNTWLESDSISFEDCYSITYNNLIYNHSGKYWQIVDGLNNQDTLMQLNIHINLDNMNILKTESTLSSTISGASYQWLDCLNGNQAILGATNQSFTATQNGEYAVIVTENSCSDTSTCVLVANVGITDLDSKTFNISPNPTSDFLNLNFEKNLEYLSFNLISLSGQLVLQESHLSGKEITIDLSSQAKGMYLLELEIEGKKEVLKVIKE